MDSGTGQARAVLREGGVEFDERDATLFQEISRTGSVAKASTNLGRSRARALRRIEDLEAVFGELVERRRGGKAGGGSQLTDRAIELVNRYSRLQAALTATAQVPETVLHGTVTAVTGELADVETQIGTIRGLLDGLNNDERVQVRVGADAITVLDPAANVESNSTSARNRFTGAISGIDEGETVWTVAVDVGGIAFRALLTEDSATRLNVHVGSEVVITWKATATRLTVESRPM